MKIQADLLAAGLQAAFERLDALLADAVRQALQQADAHDPWRGLHIDARELERLFARPPGQPRLWSEAAAAPDAVLGGCWPFTLLRGRLGLSAFDLDIIVIALAPEFDLRYERLFAFVQDDVTRKRPQMNLALDLLCQSAEDKLARRRHFQPDAPLMRHRLINLQPDEQAPGASTLSQGLSVDTQVARWLLGGHDDVHPHLRATCRLVAPALDMADLELPATTRTALTTLARSARDAGRSLLLHFQGPGGAGKRSAAQALARTIDAGLLEVDLPLLLGNTEDRSQFVALLRREMLVRGAVVHMTGLDAALQREHEAQIALLLSALSAHAGIVVVSGVSHSGRLGDSAIEVPFDAPDFACRRALWRRQLGGALLQAGDAQLDELSSRFRLGPGQIARAAAQARTFADWRSASLASAAVGDLPAQPADLFQAVRAQAGHALARLARKVDSKQRWDDLVLPAGVATQLREICDQVAHRHTVYGDWGFDRKLSLGKGVSALFCGPPGTGKTLAAEVIAAELNLDMYKIDLSRIVSKYIGETEKNLDAVFVAAQDANAILFFDEADALFGKRSEVKDAHDRYANIEVAYLLQKMEAHEGIAILATNLRHHLDDAFVRRLHAIVEFPFPDEAQRLALWRASLPDEAPLDRDVDLRVLARDVRLAGGNIKNIVLAAAFLAARDGGAIGMAQLVHAAQQEHRKLGRSWNEPVADGGAASPAAHPAREAA